MKKIFSDADPKAKKLNESNVTFSFFIFVLVINDNRLNIDPTVKTSNPEVIIEKTSKYIACFFLFNDKTIHKFFSKSFISLFKKFDCY